MSSFVIVRQERMREVFFTILNREGLSEDKASRCADVLTDNTVDGVQSHGVVRFEQFADKLQKGIMLRDSEPVLVNAFNAIEQWDGNQGIGPLNGLAMMDRAMALADRFGVGIAAIRNTTHWMRGATYGYHAARKGYFGICWTNTMANMCAWGTRSEVLGNNPIVFAAPGEKQPVVLDMALSQYAYGKLTAMSLEGKTLPVMGGYDKDGNLTDDPNRILEARGALPIGYWKGSGFAFILDILAACFSCGTSVLFMPEEGPKVSQIYIAVKPPAFNDAYVDRMVQKLKDECGKNGDSVSYPGEGTALRRAENMRDGIRVDSGVWESIMGRYERCLAV